MSNEKTLKEVNTILWHMAEGITDLIDDTRKKEADFIASDIRFLKVGLDILRKKYINEFGYNVYSLRNFDRSNLTLQEEAQYINVIESYKIYKKFFETMQTITVENPKETQSIRDKIKLNKALKGVKKTFNSEAKSLKSLM